MNYVRDHSENISLFLYFEFVLATTLSNYVGGDAYGRESYQSWDPSLFQREKRKCRETIRKYYVSQGNRWFSEDGPRTQVLSCLIFKDRRERIRVLIDMIKILHQSNSIFIGLK